jgi:hypothetical protein
MQRDDAKFKKNGTSVEIVTDFIFSIFCSTYALDLCNRALLYWAL